MPTIIAASRSSQAKPGRSQMHNRFFKGGSIWSDKAVESGNDGDMPSPNSRAFKNQSL
jgi:hypothetical protein